MSSFSDKKTPVVSSVVPYPWQSIVSQRLVVNGVETARTDMIMMGEGRRVVK